jgi:transcriptional regulator with XRE-family HTH domain
LTGPDIYGLIGLMKKPDMKTWLKENEFTYEAFAQELGFSKQRLSAIINGVESPSFESALDIWRATGYEVRLASLYPKLGKILPDIKEIARGEK